MGEIKHWHGFSIDWVYKIFIILKTLLFGVYLKHSYFWALADAKPMLNDLAHSIQWLYMHSLYV
jgi:hypothetical protein